MIYNKSGHPVEVKKISIRLWTLRDEIEAAIGRRMKECEAAGVPLYVEDIKRFYNLNQAAPLTDQSNVLQMTSLLEKVGEESKTLNEAEETIAEQTKEGLDNKKPNPILDRPYQRQAPDLDKVSYGFSLLSDMNMEALLCFTKDKFLQGQSVVVEFLIPQNFMMTAEISYCHHYAMRSRIISTSKPDYRLQCKFSFAISGERDNLRNFLKSIEPTIPEKKKDKPPKEDDVLGI